MDVVNFMVNVAKNTLLGYIKLIKVGEGGVATERSLDVLTAAEMANFMSSKLTSYYKLGDYWYTVL